MSDKEHDGLPVRQGLMEVGDFALPRAIAAAITVCLRPVSRALVYRRTIGGDVGLIWHFGGFQVIRTYRR